MYIVKSLLLPKIVRSLLMPYIVKSLLLPYTVKALSFSKILTFCIITVKNKIFYKLYIVKLLLKL
jgi:hypothetical protein